MWEIALRTIITGYFYRIAQVYDIPIANNKATADFLITSPFMNSEYEHTVINFQQNIKDRAGRL